MGAEVCAYYPQPHTWNLGDVYDRICPGQNFFREIFFLEVVMILATLKIERCKDEYGREIIVTQERTDNSAIS